MNLKTILIIAGCSYIFPATAQERTMELSLDETVKLAKLQSNRTPQFPLSLLEL